MIFRIYSKRKIEFYILIRQLRTDHLDYTDRSVLRTVLEVKLFSHFHWFLLISLAGQMTPLTFFFVP